MAYYIRSDICNKSTRTCKIEYWGNVCTDARLIYVVDRAALRAIALSLFYFGWQSKLQFMLYCVCNHDSQARKLSIQMVFNELPAQVTKAFFEISLS